MRKNICLLVALLMVTGLTLSAQATDYSIYSGSATVDGNLGEWTGANWIDMNVNFYSEGSGAYDLSGPKWAARWDSATNLIYVAVTGVDAVHKLSTTPVTWNGGDMAEIYIDAGNTNQADYYTGADGAFVYAQQLTFGRGVADGTEWGVVAGQSTPEHEALNSGVVAAYKSSIVGDVYSYEMAIKPYEYFIFEDPASSTEYVLESGMVIGFDVIMSSQNDAGFGMKCENNIQAKWASAANFADYTLVDAVINLPGDANGDGVVNVGDLGILAGNYGTLTGATWAMGDFNGDGAVNVGDLGILAGNYGSSAAAAVPEPMTLLVLVGGGLIAGLKRKA
jgi:hypothetical protein